MWESNFRRLHHERIIYMAEPKKKATTAKKAVTKKKEEPVVTKAEKDTSVAVNEEGNVEQIADSPEPTVAKAGKRSPKALKEEAEKAAKEERKAAKADESSVVAKPVKKIRTRLERRGKHYRKSSELLEIGKIYPLAEAVSLAKKTSHVKFDASIELHVNLGVDPKHADQNVRDIVVLPAGTGKKVRVAVLTDDTVTAEKAGADIAGTDALLNQIDKGELNFDVLISTPQLMSRLGKYARVLGPRGLMPNPKSGTVTADIVKGITDAKAGRVEYRVDSTGIVHLGLGKVSFTEPQILDNVKAVLASISSNKPQNVKGNYFKSVHLSTSMGPSVTVDLSTIN